MSPLLNYSNPEASIQVYIEVHLLGDARSCPVDSINHHSRGGTSEVSEAELMSSAGYCLLGRSLWELRGHDQAPAGDYGLPDNRMQAHRDREQCRQEQLEPGTAAKQPYPVPEGSAFSENFRE